MRRLVVVGVMVSLFSIVSAGQQFDAAFGVSTIHSTSGADASGDHTPQSIGGGAFPGFSADALFFHHLGIEGELFWRLQQSTYLPGTADQPFRPLFWNINAIYARRVGHIGFEALAGLGAMSARFYQPYYYCTYTCTNHVSLNHFDADFGAGVRLYVGRGFFVRPEARIYLIRNNLEFSSGTAERVGASLGYTFGEH